jgi:SP family galactose:H+ symporter-like MFS transporter
MVNRARLAMNVYLQVAPRQYRGAMITMNEVMITVGVLVAYAADYAFAGMAGTRLTNIYTVAQVVNRSGGWRWMFGTSGFFAAVQLLGMLFMPRSPRWLYDRGMKEEARSALGVCSRLDACGLTSSLLHGDVLTCIYV